MTLRRTFVVSPPFRRTFAIPPPSRRNVITWVGIAMKKHHTPKTLPSLPPPAPQIAPTEINLHRRAVLVSGVKCEHWELPAIVQKVHGGALEFARFQPGWGGLTLSFLLSHSADEFVRKTLSDPEALQRFANNESASWEWLPPAPLAPSISGLSMPQKKNKPRRALFITHWTDPDFGAKGTYSRFGKLEFVWRLHGRKTVVQYYEIADAIRAHTELYADRRVSVGYYSDWCEMSDEQRKWLLWRKSTRDLPTGGSASRPAETGEAALASDKARKLSPKTEPDTTRNEAQGAHEEAEYPVGGEPQQKAAAPSA